jgi:hypothetical protein
MLRDVQLIILTLRAGSFTLIWNHHFSKQSATTGSLQLVPFTSYSGGMGDDDIARCVELGVVEENTRYFVRRRADKFDQDH